MAFPTTGLLDNFNRTNEDPMNGNWSVGPLDTTAEDLQIVSNQAKGTIDVNDNEMWWNPGTFGADSEVYCTLVTVTFNDDLFLELRITDPGGANRSGYKIEFVPAGNSPSTGDVEMFEVTDGTSTQIGATETGIVISSGDKLGFEAISSTLKFYLDTGGGFSEQFSRSDSTHTGAGFIGIAVFDDDSPIDDFSGGTVVVAGVTIPIMLHHYKHVGGL